jgi:cobalt-zinc-cadmium efflux system protein
VHAVPDSGVAFAVGSGVNAGFVVLQVVFGLIAGSVALLADALHNLGDVLGLLLAWGAAGMGRWRPTGRHTYGFGRSSILAALVNAAVLLVGCGAIAVEGIRRFGDPAPVAGGTVMWVAAAGILVNGGTALLFMRGQSDDLNVRAAFLHLASDALVSLGVVVAGGVILLTGWHWVDPVTSLGIAGAIAWGTWGVMRQSVELAMDAVPRGIDRPAVEAALGALPGVSEVHDLHIWGLSTTESALTAHLVSDAPGADLVETACIMLQERFRIGHATVQVEHAGLAARCRLRPAEIV